MWIEYIADNVRVLYVQTALRRRHSSIERSNYITRKGTKYEPLLSFITTMTTVVTTAQFSVRRGARQSTAADAGTKRLPHVATFFSSNTLHRLWCTSTPSQLPRHGKYNEMDTRVVLGLRPAYANMVACYTGRPLVH